MIKIMYFEVCDEVPAKSTEKTMDTLGMIEDEFDPAPVTMTNNQGDIPSFGQQDVSPTDAPIHGTHQYVDWSLAAPPSASKARHSTCLQVQDQEPRGLGRGPGEINRGGH